MIKRLSFAYRLSIALLLVVSLLAVPAGIGFATINITGTPTNSTLSGSNQITSFDDSKFVETSLTSNVVDTLKSAMTDLITLQAQTCHFDIKSLQIDITSEKSNGNEVEVAFNTQYLHRLNIAKPEDAAVIKGQIKYLNANNKGMSAQSITIVQGKIAHWKQQIAEYMNTYVPSAGSFKAIAQVDSNDAVIPGTIQLYGEDPKGDFIPANNFLGHTDNEVEQNAYDATKTAVEEAVQQSQSGLAVHPNYTYNGGAALNYAVSYTSNPTATCDGTTVQNKTKYNTSFYAITCNDCANYVSQAMNAGGIPMDYSGGWYGSSTDAGTSLKWKSVPDLESYMTSYGHWSSSSWAGLLSGGVIEMTPARGGYYHVMMCIYNYGNLMEYSAHTSDRNYYSWPSGSSAYYWNVS